jgi:hypothetical protein
VRKSTTALVWGLVLLFANATCSLAPNRAAASQVTIADFADGYAESPTGNGTYSVLNTSATDLVIRQFTGTVEDRALANFNLSALPAHAVITSVSLKFDNVVITGNPSRTVDILGFNTSGGVTLAEATATASALGSYDSFALGLGNQTVALSTATFQSLFKSSNIVGLRLQGDAETVNTAIASSRYPISNEGPELVINYTSTPEPATLTQALLFIALGGCAWWYKRRQVSLGQCGV